MPKTTARRKRTKFERLNKAQRKECVEWMCERLSEQFEPSFLTDDFKTDLVDHYHLNAIQNVYWSLGYCQGDGVTLQGLIALHDLRQHYPELEGLMAHVEGVAALMGVENDCINCAHCKLSSHHNSQGADVEFEWLFEDGDTDLLDELVTNVERWVKEFVDRVEKELAKHGYEYIEEYASEEWAIEQLNDDASLVQEWLELQGDDE